MTVLVHCVMLVLAIAVGACSASPPHAANLPAPIEATTIDSGDVFELRVVGEDKLPTEFTVAPDGTVDVPYIKRIKVAGLEPQDVAALVRARLMEEQYFTDPSVSVSVKAYNSKRIEVLGQVQKPGSFPLEPRMTLLRAISLAGGFSSIANRDKIIIRRKVKDGRTVADTVSADDISANRIPDVLLQAGDSIDVKQRVF
ncbi:polysaccharide biosynthesis/export family protein [Chondromyces apiculatus]|uniref:Periplasmic protein involved in polysaccharide export n=1 Tax=Chondromyces apiculatus DSM 436 TaxID=1192034 RepID=A0A017TI38_9BACT|nr:polysaccharide biosynthesis/export family protein [Chondromyces apiculatus]EYF08943.1 Periplasmic protein involved in polysaccharide export [Chondromyces apiculatus DSM 436]